MKYLLDTCVISEMVKKSPNKSVIQWLGSQDEDHFFLSVLTLGELQKGIMRLPDGKKKRILGTWVDQDLRKRFEQRLLPVDSEVAEQWGIICARAEESGRTLPAIDGLIASTAATYGLTVVTRNVKDMEPAGILLLNPWE